MRMVKLMVPFVLALIITAGAQAADKGGDPKHLAGELAAKPADAKPGVVAILITHGHKGKDGTMTEGKKYHLVADGAVATQIADFLAKGTKVEVTGSGTEEEYKVATVSEGKHKAK